MIYLDKFKIALQHHEKNNLKEAEKLYLNILKTNPIVNNMNDGIP